MAQVLIKFLKILFLRACIWLVITPIDVDNAILLFDFSSYAGTQIVVMSVWRCFRNVPIVELRALRNFQDFAFLGNEICAELPNFFVLVDTVDDKGYIECGVISGDSKISVHKFFSLKFVVKTFNH